MLFHTRFELRLNVSFLGFSLFLSVAMFVASAHAALFLHDVLLKSFRSHRLTAHPLYVLRTVSAFSLSLYHDLSVRLSIVSFFFLIVSVLVLLPRMRCCILNFSINVLVANSTSIVGIYRLCRSPGKSEHCRFCAALRVCVNIAMYMRYATIFLWFLMLHSFDAVRCPYIR